MHSFLCLFVDKISFHLKGSDVVLFSVKLFYVFFVIKKNEISSFSGVFACYDHNLKLTVLLASADGL